METCSINIFLVQKLSLVCPSTNLNIHTPHEIKTPHEIEHGKPSKHVTKRSQGQLTKPPHELCTYQQTLKKIMYM